MSCDLEHHATNRELAELRATNRELAELRATEGTDVQLAYDGQVLEGLRTACGGGMKGGDAQLANEPPERSLEPEPERAFPRPEPEPEPEPEPVSTSPPPEGAPTFDIVFMGTGVRTRLPRLDHVLGGTCPVCTKLVNSEEDDPNRRNNVSILIKSGGKHILVDAGKSMFTAACQCFPKHGVKSVDAVLLTHGHADAAGGVDDLRDLQQFERLQDSDGNGVYKLKSSGGPIKVISNQKTIKEVQHQSPHLFEAFPWADEAKGLMKRRVAAIEWIPIEDHTDEIPHMPIPIRSFPVYHGGDNICLAFAIGGNDQNWPFVYISNVTALPEDTAALLDKPEIGTLVLDTCKRAKLYSHLGLAQALDLIRELKPQRTLLVGMSCDLEHYATNRKLAELRVTEGIDVQLAYDGHVLEGLRTAC